jgi:glycerol kinase
LEVHLAMRQVHKSASPSKLRTLLSIDQGTTNTKALLIDESGAIIASASHSVGQSYPASAWVEQDAMELWKSVQRVIESCLAEADTGKLAALAVTNQRESVLLWDRRSGQPLGPCIGWQCRRTASACEELKAGGHEALIRERTGLVIDPLFSATKARWLLDHVEDGQRRAEQGELCIGTVDSWLLWNLTGGQVHGCDMSNAARTQLFNIYTLRWDEDLLTLFGIPPSTLPVVKPSSALHGTTARIGTLPAGLPIASLIGDSHAALFGQAGFRPGVIKATYGTGSSLMTPTADPVISSHGLATTIAWGRGEQVTYALEGNISVTGAAVQWLGDFLLQYPQTDRRDEGASPIPQPATTPGSAYHGKPNRANDFSSGLSDSARYVAKLATSVPDTHGLYFAPAFVGLGAPYWVEAARGVMTGFTQGTTAAHLARATLEAITYQVRDVFEAMQKDLTSPLSVLLADGGASQNDHLMQLQADILGKPVQRNSASDVSALGAAYLAGLAIGVWSSEEEIEGLARRSDRFTPRIGESERERLYTGWRRAIAQTMLGHSPEAPS